MTLTNSRTWMNPENRRLSEIQERDGRFGIGPMTINSLDRIGLNHLEIINLLPVIGVSPLKYTAADADHLNDLEERYNILFNAEYKYRYADGKLTVRGYLTKPIDHVCWGWDAAKKLWQGVTGLKKCEENNCW